ncbi:MAG: hypothetical protein U1F26_02785 [Lysobacterales bacterium]
MHSPDAPTQAPERRRLLGLLAAATAGSLLAPPRAPQAASAGLKSTNANQQGLSGVW